MSLETIFNARRIGTASCLTRRAFGEDERLNGSEPRRYCLGRTSDAAQIPNLNYARRSWGTNLSNISHSSPYPTTHLKNISRSFFTKMKIFERFALLIRIDNKGATIWHASTTALRKNGRKWRRSLRMTPARSAGDSTVQGGRLRGTHTKSSEQAPRRGCWKSASSLPLASS